MTDTLRCIFLPVDGKTLILPYTSIVEVVPLENLKPVEGREAYVVGELEWQEIKFPVMSFAKLDNEPASPLNQKAHIAILNLVIETKVFDFMGMILYGFPTMKTIRPSDIKELSACTEPYLLMEVAARNQHAYIPNLEWIQQKLASAVTS